MFETVLDKTIPSKPIVIPPITGDDVRAMYAKQGLVPHEFEEMPDGYTFYGPSPELIDRMAVQLMWQSKFGRQYFMSGVEQTEDALMRQWLATNPTFKVGGSRVRLYSDNALVDAFVDDDNVIYEWRLAFAGVIFEKHGQLVYADRKDTDGIFSSLEIVYAQSGKRFLLKSLLKPSVFECTVDLAKAIWTEFGIPVV